MFFLDDRLEQARLEAEQQQMARDQSHQIPVESHDATHAGTHAPTHAPAHSITENDVTDKSAPAPAPAHIPATQTAPTRENGHDVAAKKAQASESEPIKPKG
jgi:hypothetical protein